MKKSDVVGIIGVCFLFLAVDCPFGMAVTFGGWIVKWDGPQAIIFACSLSATTIGFSFLLLLLGYTIISTAAEMDKQERQRHHHDCGTKYRGCDPDCPKDAKEREL